MSQDVGEGIAVRRSLAILRRLRRGPASKEQLITAVLEEVGAEAYPESETARQAAFKHDKAKLRTQFGVDFTRDPREDRYVLNDAGPYGYVELSPMARQALRVLSETFDGAAGQYAEIRALLDELTRGLAPEARRDLDRRTPPVELDIQQGIDPARLNERVWKTVTRAVQERRKLAFNYISPQHDDRQPRYHEVAPLQIRFQRGHWYLYLYDLLVRSPDGSEWRSQRYFHLRLQYIQDDERLLVLPGVLPAQQRAAPRFKVRYQLEPAIARGTISQHFTEVKTTPLPGERVEVEAITDDAWEAARILLAYGEQCTVLGGEEVLNRMRQAVEGMAKNYGLLEK